VLTTSVVIPVRNGARTLPVCLAALARLDPAPLELVLVDNGSTDGSRELLEAVVRDGAGPSARLLVESRRGAAAARNTGFAAAKGELIAFTDADCAPEPDWLARLTEPFASPGVGAVAGRVIGAPGGSVVERFSALYTLRSPGEPARHTRWTPWAGGFPTANLAVPRALLEELAGFDPELLVGEDYDLCARLYARGAEIAYVPAARVAHHHRTTVGGLLRQAFGFGQSHPDLLRRHAPRGLWIDLPGCPVAWPRCPVAAWLDLASADKKLLALLALAAASPPTLLLLACYLLWLPITATRQARKAGIRASATASLGLAGLLVLKSAAMTAGRWWGSVRYRAACL
jgi:GT2 family glycosyltransferase